MQFERLDKQKHDRKNFDCGKEVLNSYLQRLANQDQQRSLTKIYVLADAKRVIGYYSISAHSVKRDELPEDIKVGGYKDLPFLLLSRLAVDKQYQGQGYSDALIFHAFKTTTEAAESIGILGMIVAAKDDQAASFYEDFGFRRVTGSRNRLALPLSNISRLLLEDA